MLYKRCSGAWHRHFLPIAARYVKGEFDMTKRLALAVWLVLGIFVATTAVTVLLGVEPAYSRKNNDG
jgi:hypothetical protein